jgi:Predicted periplasmic or secreted lipoprotein
MTRRKSLTIAAVAVAGISASAIWMVTQHSDKTTSIPRSDAAMMAPAPSPSPDPATVETAILRENLPISGLSVRSVGPIVILRGNGTPESASRAESVAKGLGCTRVANLIQNTVATDDEGIRRQAERQLANSRALDGCTLRVSCQNGVVHVTGNVQSELQKDAARLVLRNLDGVKDVKIDLSKV